MPKIPQYIAQQGIKTGPVADQINVGAMAAPAAAIGTYSGALQDVAGFIDAREKAKELRWGGDAEYKFTNAVTEWHMANKGRDDYGPAFKEYAEKLANDFVSAAPSKRAGQALQMSLQKSISRQYDTALRIGEDNRNERFALAENDATQSYMELYRNFNDPVVLEGQLVSQLSRISASYDDTAPKFAAKMRMDATVSVVSGIMDTDPEYAEMIASESKDIPETMRQSLLDKIRATKRQLSALNADAFKLSVSDELGNAQLNNRAAVQPSAAAYKATFGDERTATLQYELDRRKFEVYNGARDVTREFEGKSPAAIQRDLTGIAGKYSGDVGADIYKAAAARADDMQKMALAHTVEYLQAYNPVVSRALSVYKSAPDDQKAGAFRQVADATLKYQGHAPEGAPDADYYLGLDSHQLSVVPRAAARDFASSMNSGTPDAALKAVREFENAYPDPIVRDIAWRDLTQLPDGEKVDQSVQMLALHVNSPIGRQLAGALQNVENNLKSKGQKYEDYNKALTAPEWDAFARLYGGDNSQRRGAVAGFRHAVIAYAASLNDQRTPDQAVNAATKALIGGRFTFESIGGTALPFAKWAGPDGRERTDDEMKLVVGRVKYQFDDSVDAGQILTSSNGVQLWPLATRGATQQSIDAYIKQDIDKNKTLVPAEDGKGFYVYLKTEMGIPFQLRTKDNRPLYIAFDENSDRQNYPNASKAGRVERIKEIQRSWNGFDIPQAPRKDRINKPGGYVPE